MTVDQPKVSELDAKALEAAWAAINPLVADHYGAAAGRASVQVSGLTTLVAEPAIRAYLAALPRPKETTAGRAGEGEAVAWVSQKTLDAFKDNPWINGECWSSNRDGNRNQVALYATPTSERAQALEEAAKIADANVRWPGSGSSGPEAAASMTAEKIAASIRTLKSTSGT